jgi:hypothetical protein
MPHHELLPQGDAQSYERAAQAAAVLPEAQLDLAAREAGLPAWMRGVGRYSMERIATSVQEVLCMPAPSPVTQEYRQQLGLPKSVGGRVVGWSLALERSPHTSEVDTGVRLVVVHTIPGADKRGRFPLDVTVPRHSLAIIRTRPDKLYVHIGERQLPDPKLFAYGDAQRLLLVARRFVGLLASGEGAELVPTRPGMGRRWPSIHRRRPE